MFMFILLSIILVFSRLHIVGDKSYWISSQPPASTMIVKSIHGHTLYIESAFYGNLVQPVRRRLLENPRGIKQAYNDYNAIRKTRYQPRNKLDENKFYRSVVENDEDRDENDEEEEEENNREIDDKNIDEETAEDEAGNEEEMVVVASNGLKNRVRSGLYMPFRGKTTDKYERQEVVRIRSVTEECEDESTDLSQYYEYETEVRNNASQDSEEHREMLFATILGANILTFLLI
ncbi:nucleolar protein 12-like isoform X1 [Pseudomyrmex gracilis]|uniref:nucleolar protein 12-like isoform X1 n=1 Tax=Pseudomyrmex gracilis TaxID=219809 RepID=UPI000995A1EA|nr:nucleolar protein 12-like isoform X1 [Pseudomyrmex gracilis]